MSPEARKRGVLIACLAAVFAMVGAAYAAVPLYNMFCRVTGFGGTTQVATTGPTQILDRTVTVRFDGSVADAPLKFTPEQRTIDVRLGERALAYYTVTNMSDRTVNAVASYNVSPFKTGPYFSKLQCFCFTEQQFAPHESRELAVLFFVDPEMDSERRLDDVREITLSYTFFEKAGGKAGTVAARDEGESAGG